MNQNKNPRLTTRVFFCLAKQDIFSTMKKSLFLYAK